MSTDLVNNNSDEEFLKEWDFIDKVKNDSATNNSDGESSIEIIEREVLDVSNSSGDESDIEFSAAAQNNVNDLEMLADEQDSYIDRLPQQYDILPSFLALITIVIALCVNLIVYSNKMRESSADTKTNFENTDIPPYLEVYRTIQSLEMKIIPSFESINEMINLLHGVSSLNYTTYRLKMPVARDAVINDYRLLLLNKDAFHRSVERYAYLINKFVDDISAANDRLKIDLLCGLPSSEMKKPEEKIYNEDNISPSLLVTATSSETDTNENGHQSEEDIINNNTIDRKLTNVDDNTKNPILKNNNNNNGYSNDYDKKVDIGKCLKMLDKHFKKCGDKKKCRKIEFHSSGCPSDIVTELLNRNNGYETYRKIVTLKTNDYTKNCRQSYCYTDNNDFERIKNDETLTKSNYFSLKSINHDNLDSSLDNDNDDNRQNDNCHNDNWYYWRDKPSSTSRDSNKVVTPRKEFKKYTDTLALRRTGDEQIKIFTTTNNNNNFWYSKGNKLIDRIKKVHSDLFPNEWFTNKRNKFKKASKEIFKHLEKVLNKLQKQYRVL